MKFCLPILIIIMFIKTILDLEYMGGNLKLQGMLYNLF